jgi:DNA-binding NarL/FixJ family response regulator
LTKLKSESATARPAEVRLLIVDDHPVFRLGLTTLLQSVPHFSLLGEASTKAEAIAQARRLRPDVILMDVRLPDGSGLELARELNQRRTSDALRVIIMSASVLPEDRDAAAAAGCDAFVAKPFHPAELVETIQRLVD